MIVQDAHLEKYFLTLVHSKRQHRPHGWAKVKSTNDYPGVINFDWNASSHTLTCRAITKGSNHPANIVADFLAYLIQKLKGRLISVLIAPTK